MNQYYNTILNYILIYFYTIGGLMRLIPVQDRASDFAELPPIFNQKHLKSTEEKVEKSSNSVRQLYKEEKKWSVSYYIWFITITILPVVTLYVFYEHIQYHINQYNIVK